VIFMAARKFGSSGAEHLTWAMNTFLPGLVAERYRNSRIVAFSTGNVYPLRAAGEGGATEATPVGPIGEYAQSALGRERMFEYGSSRYGTRVTILRLNYAVELRYGVLVDIAWKVHAGEPVELANGSFNCIWQGDANDLVLRALSLSTSPPSVWNLCLPAIFPVRDVACRFGELLGRPPQFVGAEAPTALLGNSAQLCAKLGVPLVPLETMIRWIAHWVKRGGRNLGKPTHFEVRDGNY